MKIINVIGFAILFKKLIVAVLVSIWYAFSKLIDSVTALMQDALIDLINE